MRLYHSTDHAGKAGIQKEGFALPVDETDRPGHSWFVTWKDPNVTTVKDRDWWVSIDVPEAEGGRFRYVTTTDPPDALQDLGATPMYCLPHEEANRHRSSLAFERWD